MYESYVIGSFVSAVQTMLDDDSTIYGDALVTAAIRRALNYINVRCPMYDSVTLTTVSGTLEYTLDDFEGKPITVLSVTLTENEDEPDLEPEGFYFYRINGTTPALRLRVDYGDHTDYLTVRYSEPHTIDGLNDAGITSLPDHLAEALIIGAAGFAVQQRAGSRVEANNLDDNTTEGLRAISQDFLLQFDIALQPYTQERPPAAAIPQTYWPLDDWVTT